MVRGDARNTVRHAVRAGALLIGDPESVVAKLLRYGEALGRHRTLELSDTVRRSGGIARSNFQMTVVGWPPQRCSRD